MGKCVIRFFVERERDRVGSLRCDQAVGYVARWRHVSRRGTQDEDSRGGLSWPPMSTGA